VSQLSVEITHEVPPYKRFITGSLLPMDMVSFIIHHNKIGELGKKISNYLTMGLFLYIFADHCSRIRRKPAPGSGANSPGSGYISVATL